jgi:2-oxoglutarate ferredoxin oxidoreductase subunit alpha
MREGLFEEGVMKTDIIEDINIVLAGEAGQGIQSIESILAKVLKKSGYNLFATKEYMSRVRGGVNSTLVRVSSKRVRAYTDRIDILIALSDESIARLKKRINGKTRIISYAPFEQIASAAGNTIYSSSVAAGFVCGLLGIDEALMTEIIEERFKDKSEDIRKNNRDCSVKGHAMGRDYLEKEVNVSIQKDVRIQKEMVLSGAEAIALGALAGGCNYVCAYPMSPSTGVLHELARYSREADIIVEQIEDEVGALNMALGAWYAGAKALVTTSGGGFALMTEALSLCGMIESPAVIILAQRPGPATGLPTRTEQGDLNLALFAGHGAFPRVILAPGSLEEAYELTAFSFDIAGKYQVPVILLADQFMIDSYYNIPVLRVPGKRPMNYIERTGPDYKRYKLSKDGISPRGIPGYGEGFVRLDSDEHDEDGHITEDLELRVKMVDKRLRRMKFLEDEAVLPRLYGSEVYDNLIIGWGSTDAMITEAFDILKPAGTSYLHFSQVYPLPDGADKYLKEAKNIACIENNETGQFADLLQQVTGYRIKKRILKYSGLPFSVEELVESLRQVF